tara:strand:+ start:5620 stop:6870 length:1251 start_codon:yes stop_codon:yes gene_type:complete
MAKIKIAAATVSGIMDAGFPNKTTYYYDTEVAGFGLYRTPGGTGTYFAEFRPVAGGSKKRIKLGRVGTIKADDARKAARRAIANATLGKDLASERADERAAKTVSALVESYISDHVATKRKPATAANYRATLRAHITPHIGSTKSTALVRADVQRMHTKASKSGKYSANRAVALLSATYVWAGKNGYVPEGMNPASGIERNREEARERFLSEAEMKRLGEVLHEAETVGLPVDAGDAKHAPKGQRVKTSASVTGAIRLIMLTGCRLREILHLRWDEVDMDRGLLFLPDSKTGKKTVVLSAAAVEVLKAMPRVGGLVVASDSAGLPNEKPRADIKRPWGTITKRAGLDGLRIHDLRHSFASVGVWSGLGLPVIGKLLGHADSKTTARYAHVDVDSSKRGADLIASRIAAAIGGVRNG